MIVKTVLLSENNVTFPLHKIIECSAVEYKEIGKETEVFNIQVYDEKYQIIKNIEVFPPAIVYIMNNEGKTVDVIRFNVK